MKYIDTCLAYLAASYTYMCKNEYTLLELISEIETLLSGGIRSVIAFSTCLD